MGIVLKNSSAPGTLPWQLEILRRGSYFFLTINGKQLSWANHPAGDIDCKAGAVRGDEPLVSTISIRSTSLTVNNVSEQCIRWESSLQTQPILTHGGGNGSWYEGQLFPGAVLTVNQTHYLYLCGSDLGAPGQESGGHVRSGVASTQDPELKDWDLHRSPVLDLGDTGSWDSANVFVNGAVTTPDGGVALTYAADAFPTSGWGGIGVAFADSPLGPFHKHPHPVLPVGEAGEWDATIHEHTITRLSNGSYMIFYTGFGSQPYGYQGGLAFSEDLLSWRKSSHNPVLRHDPNSANWDGAHRRPRSLDLIDGMWYLLYEGATAVDHTCYRDSIGLARSKDLLNWETHPLKVAVPQQAGARFDSIWTGWPRALIKGGNVHVFYSAGGADFVNAGTHHFASTGLRSVPIERYTNWTISWPRLHMNESYDF